MQTTVDLPDDLDKKFRETVGQTMGYKRGNFTKAFVEALNDWIEKQEKAKLAKSRKPGKAP